MLANLLSLSACLSAALAINPPSYSGYNLVWSDNFAGAAGSRANTNNWRYATPPTPSDGEVQQYVSSTNNAQLNGQGVLQIVPQKSSSGQWTSARLESIPNFQSKVGYRFAVEASIRMGPNAVSQQAGMWPAFWALGSSFRANPATAWPACGEWDIFEAIDGQSTAHQTLHCGTYPGGKCNEPVGKTVSAGYTPTNWNTFRVEVDRKTYTAYNDWPKQTISWYLNGRLTQQISGAQVGDFNTWVNVTRLPVYLIANVAVGGAFPGEPNSATLGGLNSAMFLRYVAVYMTT